MARRLQNQQRSEYHCPAKKCPAPADLRRFPEIQREVRSEWASRREFCRSGQATARRAAAKREWPGRKKPQSQK